MYNFPHCKKYFKCIFIITFKCTGTINNKTGHFTASPCVTMCGTWSMSPTSQASHILWMVPQMVDVEHVWFKIVIPLNALLIASCRLLCVLIMWNNSHHLVCCLLFTIPQFYLSREECCQNRYRSKDVYDCHLLDIKYPYI